MADVSSIDTQKSTEINGCKLNSVKNFHLQQRKTLPHPQPASWPYAASLQTTVTPLSKFLANLLNVCHSEFPMYVLQICLGEVQYILEIPPAAPGKSFWVKCHTYLIKSAGKGALAPPPLFTGRAPLNSV